MKGLGALKKERKEKVHNFTQRFFAYLKNLSTTDKPSDKVLIEYYTSDLGSDLDMFTKAQVKPMLLDLRRGKKSRGSKGKNRRLY